MSEVILSRSIDGAVALVTGAAGGIGRSTAELFAREGARVVLADLDGSRLEIVEAEVRAMWGDESALAVPCDVSDPYQLDRLVDRAVKWAGGLHILVNNAGIAPTNHLRQPVEEFEGTWAETLAVNLTAQARLIRLVLPHLRAGDHGRIVNIASTEAIVAAAGRDAYAASKAGVIGLTQSVAVELGPSGITVNCICPGPIETPMTSDIERETKLKYARRRVPLGRYGAPEEIAHMILNLSLPSSSFVTGATIRVDGGMTVMHV